MIKRNSPRQLLSVSVAKNRTNFTVRRASILIIALWTLCFMASFCVVIGYSVRSKLSLVKRLNERDALSFIGEAGVKRGIDQIQRESKKDYISLKDDWYSNKAAFTDVALGGGSFALDIEDEASKVNINTSDIKVLSRIFSLVLNIGEQEAQDLAASVIDWRDTDSELILPLGSAEDSYYRNSVPEYEAKDTDFEVIPEVLLVKGMNKEHFDKVKNYLTIYGNGKVNINTASKQVLSALGISDDIVNDIFSYRAGEDKDLNTKDDNVFQSDSEIVSKLSQFVHLSDSEVALLSNISGKYLTVNSDYFLVKSVAQLNNSKLRLEISSVISMSGKILYWQEL